MPRPLWSGSISFGLVNIPIVLYTATHDVRTRFHMVSADGRCRLRRKLVCPDTNKEYDFNETARGLEVAPGQYVIVDPEELEKLQPESGHTIDVNTFVDLDSIDPIYFNKPYYVLPDKKGVKAYELFVAALAETKKVGIAKFVMRENEYLAALRINDEGRCIILETMHFHEEINPIEELPGSNLKIKKAGERETKLAVQLIESLSDAFNPQQYKNEYEEKVQKLIKNKGKKRHIEEGETKKPATAQGDVIDLMAALQKSLNHKERHAPLKKKKRAA